MHKSTKDSKSKNLLETGISYTQEYMIGSNNYIKRAIKVNQPTVTLKVETQPICITRCSTKQICRLKLLLYKDI